MKQMSTLTTRRHVREAINLPVELIISPEHRPQVKFSQSSTACDSNRIRGMATDISPGGMGITCSHFLPRMCEATVRIFDLNPIGMARDGSPIHEVAFEHRIKVRRVYLIGREPSYSLGAAFIDPEPDLAQRIEKLKDRLGLVGISEGTVSEEAPGHA